MIKAFPWKTREIPVSPSVPARSEEAQLNRVEATLDRLLAAVAASAEGAPQMAAREATRAPVRGLSLAAAIAQVSRRQQELENMRTASPREPQLPFGGEPQRETRARATSLLTLQNDIAGLAVRLDAMQREQTARYAAAPVCNLDKFRTEIAAMSDALRDVASRGSVATVESAIRGLSQKIEESRNDGIKDVVLRPMEELVAELRQSLAEIDPRMTIKGLEGELKKLGAKIEDLNRDRVDPAAFGSIQAQTREIRDLLSAAIARPQPMERIERQVAELAQTVNQQRTVPAYGGSAESRTDSAQFSAIEERLEEIATKVEESLNAARDQSRYRDLSDRIDGVHTRLSARIADTQRTATPDTSALEDMVRSLSDKIELATAPQTDHHAIEALEAQISALAERMEHSNTAVSINALERAISELFGEFERTRTASLEVAEQTARSAVREALGTAPDHGADQERISNELSELRTKQDEADQRTLSTLNAVHETLEKVVERLSSFESELGDRRGGGSGESLASGAAPVFAPPRDPGASKNPPSPPPFVEPRSKRAGDLDAPFSVAEDFLIEPGSGFPGRRENGNPGGQTPTAEMDSLDPPASRSDFIAAARRAAQAAQRETAAAAVLAQARPGPTLVAENKGNLLQSTRDLIAHYRRPVVLSLAAIFVAVGAYAVLKSLGHPPTKMSSIDPPAAAASLTPDQAADLRASHIRAPAIMAAAKPDDSLLSPNSILTPPPATPTAAPPSAAKVDPIVTGSIPHKPAAHESKPREISFVDLRSQARAGDARAQFALAVQYTEGRLMPRDLAAAAQWYHKAAAQGLAPAQYRLASFYEKGLGVDRDITEAQSLYQKAADQGNVRAMHNLAVLAADGGDSGRPDYAAAAHWFKRAAEFGVRDSQYNYAVLLARGMGVPQDFLASYVWFAIAAKQGDPDSATKRDDVAARLSANQLATAKAIVDGFRPRIPLPAANDFTLPVISMSTRPTTEPPPTFSFAQRPKVSML
jgi:localization factor PodJL